MNHQNNTASNKIHIDYKGKFFIRLHHLKISLSSYTYSAVNSFTWRMKGITLGAGSKFYGFAKAYRFPGSSIQIGSGCGFRSDKYSNLIGVNHPCIISTHTPAANITIGSNCGFSGLSVGCASSIMIGNNVLTGANVIITDFDWHSLDPLKRRTDIGTSKPIVINDNVFIGVNSIIWKGVTIGENSVIGANSLVTKDVAKNSVYAGNPAKFIKLLDF